MHKKKLEVALSGSSRAHRDRPIDVPESRHRRRLQRDGWKLLGLPFYIRARLNHLDLDVVLRLVVHRDRAVELTSHVKAAVHVGEEVVRGFGSMLPVDLDHDLPSSVSMRTLTSSCAEATQANEIVSSTAIARNMAILPCGRGTAYQEASPLWGEVGSRREPGDRTYKGSADAS